MKNEGEDINEKIAVDEAIVFNKIDLMAFGLHRDHAPALELRIKLYSI